VVTTQPFFLKQTISLIKKYQSASVLDIQTTMKINPVLASKTFEQFKNFSKKINNKPATHLYSGSVFTSLAADTFNTQQLLFAQNNLLIISGLYGLLRPLDTVSPYRLEIKFEYTFWKDIITNYLIQTDNIIIINLASKESTDVIDKKRLNKQIITIVFKEKKLDTFVIKATYAKIARGLMANYIIKHNIKKPEEIKKFNLANYTFNKNLSDKNNFIFVR